MSEEVETNKVLDLDELFGQARAVKVKWGGKNYELLRLEAIGPKQAMKFNKLYIRSAKLQKSMQADASDDLKDEDMVDVEAIFDEMLRLLSKELPLAEIPFMAKSRIMIFYMEQTQGKKAMEAALNQMIGENISHA